MISVLLATVRTFGAYRDQPEWHAIGKIVDDLGQQTFKDFELIVVDGSYEQHKSYVAGLKHDFPLVHVPPKENIWTRNHKVAICTFRNTGIAKARGDLIVNLDDCCTLPKIYLEAFARGWEYKVCAAMTWPERGDWRHPQLVTRPGIIYGFGSYPREAALELNGYDEAFDGAQGLEDADWSTRLFHLGVKSALISLPGFDILPQSGHDLDIVKCCNAAWQGQRVMRQVRRANVKELWTPEMLALVGGGPCQLLKNGTCAHHGQPCAYLERSWVHERHPLVEEWMREPPVFDLRRDGDGSL
jgi:hypothetical protein